MEVTGKYGKGYIFADNVEPEALSQVMMLLNQKAFEGSHVRIMPDVHAGAGCVIGFTGKFAYNRVIPNIVGVDIGCGMLTIKLGPIDMDLAAFDEYVKSVVPLGTKRNRYGSKLSEVMDFLTNYVEPAKVEKVCNRIGADFSDVLNSLGSLGGGNHFIEIDEEEQSRDKYLIIHSGSRNFGKRVAEWHQQKAERVLKQKRKDLDFWFEQQKKSLGQGKKPDALETLREEYARQMELISVPTQLSYLDGNDAALYLWDMQVAQKYAWANRELMANHILDFFKGKKAAPNLTEHDKFQTIHNYLSEKDGYIRKGAISACAGEKVLIPMNMRDGCIIGIGKGNADWNNSAPHGAGRVMSRSKAKAHLSMDEFRRQMKGIYSTTVSEETLDESPMAYKPTHEILSLLGQTVDVVARLKPIYNLKAAEDDHGWRRGRRK